MNRMFNFRSIEKIKAFDVNKRRNTKAYINSPFGYSHSYYSVNIVYYHMQASGI